MDAFKSFIKYSLKNEVFFQKTYSVNAKMKNVVTLTCQQFLMKMLAWNIGLRHTLKHVCCSHFGILSLLLILSLLSLLLILLLSLLVSLLILSFLFITYLFI